MSEWRAPQVSVVIPSYNRLDSLRDTLGGLAVQTLDFARFEVIIIDNASTDGTLEAIQAVAPALPYALRVRRIPGENRGPAPARNFGVTLARGEIIAFTDSDCRPDAVWLEMGLAAFQDDGVAFASGVVHFKPEQESQLSFFARRTVICTDEHPTYPTANIFYRKQRFMEFGGFAENLSFPSLFGIAVEAADTDLAWRLKEAGHRNAFVAGAVIYHEVQVIAPTSWLLEPLRLFLIPALVKRHPAMRSALLTCGVFFYAGSIFYYLALVCLLGVALYVPAYLSALPVLLILTSIARARSLHPKAILRRAGRIVLNAARMYVMSFALLYGSLRFGTLVL